MKHGILPLDFLRRSPGERAAVFALLIDYNRRREEARE